MSDLRCPECHEPARRLLHPFPRRGWALNVDADRLHAAHSDGEPLCPVMTASGYQPALPERKPDAPSALWAREVR